MFFEEPKHLDEIAMMVIGQFGYWQILPKNAGLPVSQSRMDRTYTFSTASADFYLQQRGERPETVFIHGFGGDCSVWDEVWSRLDPGFPALRYDLRDFGQSSSKSAEPFSHTDDLAAILSMLMLEKVNLVGVSMGGAVAINFALNYSRRIGKLVLISPALVAWEWSEEWKNLWRPMVENARSGNMDKARQLWWQHPVFANTRETAAAEQLYASIMRYSGIQWIHDNQRDELPDVERLYQLSMPTLLLTGERDMADFRLVADLLEASAPHIERIDFQHLGHSLQLEDPDAVVDAMYPFLAGEK